MIVAKPTWTADIQGLFTAPYWIPPAERGQVAGSWVRCMNAYDVFLEDPDSVKTWSETIYQHLASRNMPLTLDDRQFWPIDALETFRLWVNQGWRLNSFFAVRYRRAHPTARPAAPGQARAPGHPCVEPGTTGPVPRAAR